MRILQINKFHYIEGGTERYYWELSNLLKKKGHEVAFFSMHDQRNFPTKWSKYFVDFLSFRDVNYKDSIKIASRMIYSLEAKKRINQLLNQFHPNVVHIHNIYNHISPSILPEIKRRNIPIIQTVHDYHMLAPNRHLFHNGKICEITKKDQYFRAIFHKCIKNSYTASLLTVFTMYIHKILGLYTKYIDYYITPSNFLKKLMISYNYNPKNIIVLPYLTNFIKRSLSHTNSNNKYILYFGRLSSEKGLKFLIEVMRKIPYISLYIVGEGPELSVIQNKIREYNLKNIKLLGYLSGSRLERVIASSCFTITPSIWYENYPNSILESFAYGKPIIASDIGGIPELVRNNETGFLFIPNNVNDCIKKILTLWNNSKLVRQMGQNALKFAQEKFNAEDHYKKIIGIYNNLIEKYKQKKYQND